MNQTATGTEAAYFSDFNSSCLSLLFIDIWLVKSLILNGLVRNPNPATTLQLWENSNHFIILFLTAWYSVTHDTKIFGRDSIICTDSQKLNPAEKELAESGTVYTRLMKIRLGLRVFSGTALSGHTPLPLPPYLPSPWLWCPPLAAPSPGYYTCVTTMMVTLCPRAWSLPEHTDSTISEQETTDCPLDEGLLTGVGSLRRQVVSRKVQEVFGISIPLS